MVVDDRTAARYPHAPRELALAPLAIEQVVDRDPDVEAAPSLARDGVDDREALRRDIGQRRGTRSEPTHAESDGAVLARERDARRARDPRRARHRIAAHRTRARHRDPRIDDEPRPRHK